MGVGKSDGGWVAFDGETDGRSEGAFDGESDGRSLGLPDGRALSCSVNS